MNRSIRYITISTLAAVLTFSAANAAEIAVFNFDNSANPTENTGLGSDGALLGGAIVEDGELVVDGPDQALDIPLGLLSPFNGDDDWRVEMDVRSEGNVTSGVIFSTDSAECPGPDGAECNDADQAGTVNMFFNGGGGISLDFWWVGVIDSNETYNDDEFHHVVAEYKAETGIATLTIDDSDVVESEDWTYSRDSTMDRTRVGDETNPDAGSEWNPDGFFGRVDNVVIEAPSPPSSLVSINRDTGNVKIEAIGNDPLGLSSLALESGVGGLIPGEWTSITGNYDAAGDGSVDSANNWEVSESTVFELAENAAAAGDGGSVATNTEVDLGNIWMRSPFNDVEASVFDTTQGDTARAVVIYEGTPIALGDLNLDGDVNPDDWTVFVNGYGSDLEGLTPKEAYFMADINRDFEHSAEDYADFIEAYNAANGEGAFAAQIGVIPEPSAALLLVAGLGALSLYRRRGSGRVITLLLVSLMVVIAAVDDAQADLLAEYLFDNNDAADTSGNARDGFYDSGFGGTGGISGQVLNLSGEGFEGLSIPLDEANPFDGSQDFTIELTFNTTGLGDNGLMLMSSAHFDSAEEEDFHSMALFLNEGGGIVYDNWFVGDVVAEPTIDVYDGQDHQLRVTFVARSDLGDPDDPNPGDMFIELDGSWLVQGSIAPNVPEIENNDVSVGTSLNQTFPITEGATEFVGTVDDVRIFDDAQPPSLIAGTVDRSTGEVLINGGEFAQELAFYEIRSPGGALNPGPWGSSNLDSQGVDSEGDATGQSWDGLDGTSNRVAEGFLLGSSLVNDGRTLNLGTAYRGNSGIEDLTLTVVNTANDIFDIPLTYMGEPGEEDVCGDFDRDGDVDSADRTIQTTNWTGALPPGDPNATKTFEQGDCDGDGDVDTADQNGTITNWTGAMNPAGNIGDGDDADLYYDPATGNVVIDASDTASGQFISFVLGTDQNNMRPENLVKSADGSAGPFFDVGTNTDATTFQIGQTDPLNQGAGPLVDLGNIFPKGISTLEELAEYLTLAEYASELGQGGTFDLCCIPEPSGLVLALMGMLGFVSRRRRK